MDKYIPLKTDFKHCPLVFHVRPARKYKYIGLHYFTLIVHSNCLIYLSPSLRQSFEKAFETINTYIYILVLYHRDMSQL